MSDRAGARAEWPSARRTSAHTPQAADLLYVPPPDRPVLALHPARLDPARLASALRHSVSATAALARLTSWLREHSGREHCVPTASGRSALRLALTSLGAGPGREVVLSTFNCPAVADAVLATGARPVLVDVDPDAGPAYASVDLRGRTVVLTNGLGLDEWSRHAHAVTAHGGTPVLDLAQAVPAPAVLRRFRAVDCPLVLSFGPGKPLGGIGGGAVLYPSGTYPPGSPPGPRAAPGGADLCAAVGNHLLDRAPLLRRAVQRWQQRSPGWSHTKADHLPTAPAPVPVAGPSRWEAAVAASLLTTVDRTCAVAGATHQTVLRSVAGALEHCRFVASDPDLTSGIELLFNRRGDRLVFARALAHDGVPSTWNYYPLHRMAPYAQYAAGPMPGAEHLWPRVLTVPRQPQPRMTPARLTAALLRADRTVAERDGHATEPTRPTKHWRCISD